MAFDLNVFSDMVFRLIQDNDSIDLSTPREAPTVSLNKSLTNGTGANQADVQWHDTRTLSSGASEDLDLGALTSTLDGSALTFAKIKAIWIKNKSTTSTEVLTVGAAASNPWIGWLKGADDILDIGPSGVEFGWNPIDGWAVAATTGDVLKIAASSGDTIEYDIVIVGTTA